MARIRWKYLLFLAGVLALYLVLLYLMPKRYDWTVSLNQKDKNPFGVYIFRSLLDRSWFSEIKTTNQTVYEHSDLQEPNFLILAESVALNEMEMDTLQKLAIEGHHVFISTHAFDDKTSETLDCKINSYSFAFILDQIWGRDSIGVRFITVPYDTLAIYWLPSQLLPQYFEEYDSARYSVLATNTKNQPVLLRDNAGAGSILLSTTPLMFTNFSMVRGSNSDFVAGILSSSKSGPLLWSEYYQFGRMESGSPLRYILSVPSLSWAFYLTIIIVLTIMIIGSKRKQRVIPVIEPAKNETLQFVKTIANLYYNKKDHRGLALKKILHFTEFMKNQLRIDPNEDILEVVKLVAAKTGTGINDVSRLFGEINKTQASNYVSATFLVEFVGRIDLIIQNFQNKN